MIPQDELSWRCRFETERLDVGEWHEMSVRYGVDLALEVSTVLTATTTQALPAEWHGDFTIERATGWIAERDAESATLLAIDPASKSTIGLVILFETPAEAETGIDLRLGYVLAERAWGQGIATELVQGVVGWARAQPSIRSIAAGVLAQNSGSARVLTKTGFAPGPVVDGEQIYTLTLS